MKGPPLIRSPLIRTSEPRDIHPSRLWKAPWFWIHPPQKLDRKSISWIQPRRKEGWKHVGFYEDFHQGDGYLKKKLGSPPIWRSWNIFLVENLKPKCRVWSLNHDFGGILTSFWVSFYFGSLPTLLKPPTYRRLKIDGWKRCFISMGKNMVPFSGSNHFTFIFGSGNISTWKEPARFFSHVANKPLKNRGA